MHHLGCDEPSALRVDRSPGRSLVQRRRAAFLKTAGLYVILIGITASAYLLAPPARQSDDPCGQTVHLGRYLSFVLNCDSPNLINSALDPGSLLHPGNRYQDRPLYIISVALLTRAVSASGFGVWYRLASISAWQPLIPRSTHSKHSSISPVTLATSL